MLLLLCASTTMRTTSLIATALLTLDIYITPAAARLLAARTDDLWTVNIDNSPAPSPQDGPPLSANASRDKSLLPGQVGGIVGAYLLAVAIVGLALLLIGRRRRHEAQQSIKALDVEMIKPQLGESGFYPTPISPADQRRNFSWPSPERTDRNPYIFPTTTSPNALAQGDPFVDRRIVEADRDLLARDLEDIYAHVMEQDEAKARGITLKAAPIPPRMQGHQSPRNDMPPPAPQRQPGDRPTSHRSPKSQKPGPLDMDRSRGEKTPSRASSLISSLKSPKRRGIRGMQISSPIATPLSGHFPGEASDEEPLSPRYHTPPPPPPVPTDQMPYRGHSRNASTDPSPISPSRSIDQQLSYPRSHQPASHHYTTSQTSSLHSRDPTSATSQTPLYTYPASATASANASTRALPFRAYEPNAASPAVSNMTKTTVLERTTAADGGPRTGLKSPWMAGAVPYSPYMPFTPVLPVTPRLVTKQERKARKKEEGRGPVLEMIKSDDEVWGDAY